MFLREYFLCVSVSLGQLSVCSAFVSLCHRHDRDLLGLLLHENYGSLWDINEQFGLVLEFQLDKFVGKTEQHRVSCFLPSSDEHGLGLVYIVVLCGDRQR